jgi:hypothetical protein
MNPGDIEPVIGSCPSAAREHFAPDQVQQIERAVMLVFDHVSQITVES